MKNTKNYIFPENISNKLYGFNNLFNNFESLFKNNKLPKILLLTGDKGIGKFTFIFHFINFLLSKKNNFSYDKDNFAFQSNNEISNRIKVNIDQNFNYLGCEKPYNTSIDTIRELKLKLSKPPLNNFPRFNVIDDIEFINLSSANALLKLIEEPSYYDYFFLINNKKNKVIETLMSRSIEFKIFLSTNDRNNVFNSLKNNLNLENNFSHNYLQYTSPGNLLKFHSILNELNINALDNFDNIIYTLLEIFKRNKNITYLNLIYFLVDIKFSEILNKNNNNFVETIDVKNKILNLFYHFNNFNLNFINVFNQYKQLFNHVR